MIRALRERERITESNIAFATLAMSTARTLDEVLAGEEKRYIVDKLARAHLLALRALDDAPGPEESDAWAEVMKAALTPTPGTPDPSTDRLNRAQRLNRGT